MNSKCRLFIVCFPGRNRDILIIYRKILKRCNPSRLRPLGSWTPRVPGPQYCQPSPGLELLGGRLLLGVDVLLSSWNAVCCKPPNPLRGPQARARSCPTSLLPGRGAISLAPSSVHCVPPTSRGTLQPYPPAAARASLPVCSGPCRTEKTEKGGGRNCRAWRDKDAPEMKRAARPMLSNFNEKSCFL